jgi:Protein of unknown function (DUF3105)
VRRALIGVAVVLVAAAACVALISLLASRDSSQVGGTSGPGVLEPDRGSQRLGSDAPQTPASPPDQPPTSGPHRDVPVTRDRAELSDDELLSALQLGNVVIFYDGGKAPDALVALQEEVSGAFDPELAAAGQAVILARRPGVGGIVALAWRRRLNASGPDDPKLRAFAEAWLGQGPG